MKTKTTKIVTTLLIAIMLVATLNSVVMATGVDADDILSQMGAAEAPDASQISTVGGQIVKIITTVGVVAAVIILAVLGIKYMVGSASEKAEYKKTMIPYLVGAGLLLGASAIVGVLFNVLGGLGTTVG